MATASAMGSHSSLVLTQSKALRLATLFVLYFVQGVPIGLFLYAVPGWMAEGGATTTDVAAVVSASTLPWSLKLVNGFLIDRYTVLAMGRRRVWIVGAQAVIVLALLVGAMQAPDSRDVALLVALSFVANLAVTFQDVGIDSLAVDIMPKDERAKAGGIMMGAQLVGVSATTAAAGLMIDSLGIASALAVVASLPLLAMLFVAAIRERAGERLLPWTKGEAHPHNREVQVEAWWPLLKASFRALFVSFSLVFVPILMLRMIPIGAYDAFHPELVVAVTGWTTSDYTGTISSAYLASGVFGLLVGGWLVDRIGPVRGLLLATGGGAVVIATMGALPSLWSEGWFVTTIIVLTFLSATIYVIAIIPVAMAQCLPSVAATQLTIYMALSNLGRPAGAWLAPLTAGQGTPQWLYWISAGCMVVALLLVLRLPRQQNAQAVERVAETQPQATGMPAQID